MPKFNIVVLAGDYAGPEVTAEAVKVCQTTSSRKDLASAIPMMCWSGSGIDGLAHH